MLQTVWQWKAISGSHTFSAFATTSSTMGWNWVLPDDSVDPFILHKHPHHHRNNSILHHPLQAILFFCVISTIFDNLLKILPWLMMCHRLGYNWTTACCVLRSKTWRIHQTYAWEYMWVQYPPTLWDTYVLLKASHKHDEETKVGKKTWNALHWQIWSVTVIKNFPHFGALGSLASCHMHYMWYSRERMGQMKGLLGFDKNKHTYR